MLDIATPRMGALVSYIAYEDQRQGDVSLPDALVDQMTEAEQAYIRSNLTSLMPTFKGDLGLDLSFFIDEAQSLWIAFRGTEFLTLSDGIWDGLVETLLDLISDLDLALITGYPSQQLQSVSNWLAGEESQPIDFKGFSNINIVGHSLGGALSNSALPLLDPYLAENSEVRVMTYNGAGVGRYALFEPDFPRSDTDAHYQHFVGQGGWEVTSSDALMARTGEQTFTFIPYSDSPSIAAQFSTHSIDALYHSFQIQYLLQQAASSPLNNIQTSDALFFSSAAPEQAYQALHQQLYPSLGYAVEGAESDPLSVKLALEQLLQVIQKGEAALIPMFALSDNEVVEHLLSGVTYSQLIKFLSGAPFLLSHASDEHHIQMTEASAVAAVRHWQSQLNFHYQEGQIDEAYAKHLPLKPVSSEELHTALFALRAAELFDSELATYEAQRFDGIQSIRAGLMLDYDFYEPSQLDELSRFWGFSAFSENWQTETPSDLPRVAGLITGAEQVHLEGSFEDEVFILKSGWVEGQGGDDVIALLEANTSDSLSLQTDMIQTGDGHDVVQGNSRDQHIYSGAGNDRIFSGGGDDYIYADAGQNFIFADGISYQATVDGAFGWVQSLETPSYWGQELGSDVAVALGEGIQLLVGGGGDDSLYARSDQHDVVIIGNDAPSNLDLGEVSIVERPLPLSAHGDNRMVGQGERVFMVGGQGQDVFWVEAGNSFLYGNDVEHDETGFDAFITQGGDAWVETGFGDNYVLTSSGNDHVFSKGNSWVTVGAGDDWVTLLEGRAYVELGAGDDMFVADRQADHIWVAPNSGNDWLNLEGASASILIFQGDGENHLHKPGRNSALVLMDAYAEDVELLFEPEPVLAISEDTRITLGWDWFQRKLPLYEGRTGMEVHWESLPVNTLSAPDGMRLKGSYQPDVLIADEGVQFFNGLSGNDVLQGGQGNDVYRFEGNFGQDLLWDVEGINQLEIVGDPNSIIAEWSPELGMLFVESDQASGSIFIDPLSFQQVGSVVSTQGNVPVQIAQHVLDRDALVNEKLSTRYVIGAEVEHLSGGVQDDVYALNPRNLPLYLDDAGGQHDLSLPFSFSDYELIRSELGSRIQGEELDLQLSPTFLQGLNHIKTYGSWLTVKGTAYADQLKNLAEKTKLYGLGGNDRFTLHQGVSEVFSGSGDDVFQVTAGQHTLNLQGGVDTLSLGSGSGFIEVEGEVDQLKVVLHSTFRHKPYYISETEQNWQIDWRHDALGFRLPKEMVSSSHILHTNGTGQTMEAFIEAGALLEQPPFSIWQSATSIEADTHHENKWVEGTVANDHWQVNGSTEPLVLTSSGGLDTVEFVQVADSDPISLSLLHFSFDHNTYSLQRELFDVGARVPNESLLEERSAIGSQHYGTRVERIIGTSEGTEWIEGTDANNLLDFRLTAIEEIEAIKGLGGNDTLFGSLGADTLIGGAGDDEIYRTSGGDQYVFSGRWGRDILHPMYELDRDDLPLASESMERAFSEAPFPEAPNLRDQLVFNDHGRFDLWVSKGPYNEIHIESLINGSQVTVYPYSGTNSYGKGPEGHAIERIATMDGVLSGEKIEAYASFLERLPDKIVLSGSASLNASLFWQQELDRSREHQVEEVLVAEEQDYLPPERLNPADWSTQQWQQMLGVNDEELMMLAA